MTQASKRKKVFDGRYEILSIVGRGAGSVVYHARHVMSPAAELALKVLVDRKDGTSSTDKLRKEALAMVSCRHRFVVRLDDFHSVGTLCYLSLEYAPESDLRKYVRKIGGKLGPAQAEIYLLQCAEALQAVHKAGIIHRDIKPDNILVMNPREIRLADFGIAVLPGEESTPEELETGIGTMSYMAPEVLEGKTYDQKSDMYALGVSFYEMITGSHPFEHIPLLKQMEIRREGQLAPLSSIVPAVSERMSRVIMQMLHFDQSKRLATARDVIEALGGTPVADPIEFVHDSAPFPFVQEERAASSPEQPSSLSSSEVNTDPQPLSPLKSERDSDTGAVAHGECTAPAPTPVAPKVIQNPITPVSVSARPLPFESAERTVVLDRFIPGEATGPNPYAGAASGGAFLDPSRSPSSTSSREVSTFDYLQERAARARRYLGFAAAALALILAVRWITTDRSHQDDTESQSASGSGALLANDVVFPFLPSGVYSGTISSILPERKVPLTFVVTNGAYKEDRRIAVILGVDGWTPKVIELKDLVSSQSKMLRVASNGYILDLTGEVTQLDDGSGSEIVGSFRNVLTGDIGEWRVIVSK